MRPDFPRVRARDAITRYARTAPKSFTTSHPLSRPHPASVYAARAHRIFTRPRDAVRCLDSRTRLLTDRATVRLRRDRDGAGPAPGRQHATRPKAPPRPRPRGGAPVPLAVALRTGRDWRPHRHRTPPTPHLARPRARPARHSAHTEITLTGDEPRELRYPQRHGSKTWPATCHHAWRAPHA